MLHIVADGTHCVPFVHPLQPQSESMQICQRILHAYFDHNPRQSVLECIRKEHERIWFSYQSFSEWELLSAFQALVMYCILRTTFTEPSDFDLPLLLSLKEVMVRLGNLYGMQGALPDTSDRSVHVFEQWIFDETRRRTVIIFRILNLIVDVSDAIPCQLKQGFAVVPLPSKELLWRARNADDWQLPFLSQDYVIHGMSEGGELIKLTSTFAGITTSRRSWESWCAEMGEIGTLVVLSAHLLS